MLPPREPIFLARDTYRRRRLVDALRLLPVVGLFLFLSPLIGGAGYLRATAPAGIFVFSVWFGLILATFGLVRVHARAPGGPGTDPLDSDQTMASPGPAEAETARGARATGSP